MRRAFTLMELLIVILIIGLLVGLSVAAYVGAAEQARASRTRSIVNKIDQLLAAKWDGYKTRRLPMKVPYTVIPNPNGSIPPTVAIPTPPIIHAACRLNAIRDLQRMEFPDRVSDVADPPADIDPRTANTLNSFDLRLTSPALRSVYIRKASLTTWTEGLQGAECLHLILSTMRDGDKNALDFLTPDEVGDTDQDGMPEILDGWGRPLTFVRWPCGFVREQLGADNTLGTADDWGLTTTKQTRGVPDPFDVLKVDRDANGNHRAFDLRPLIVSAGRDKAFDLLTDNVSPAPLHRYCPPGTNNYPQPFTAFTDGFAGTPMDRDGDGQAGWLDNITNHSDEP